MTTFTLHVLRLPDQKKTWQELLRDGYAVITPGYLSEPVIGYTGSEIPLAPIYSFPFVTKSVNSSIEAYNPAISEKSVVSKSVDAFRAIRDGFLCSILTSYLQKLEKKPTPSSDPVASMIESLEGMTIENEPEEVVQKLFSNHLTPSLEHSHNRPVDDDSYDSIETGSKRLYLSVLLKHQSTAIRVLMKKIADKARKSFSIWLPRFKILVPSDLLLNSIMTSFEKIPKMEMAVPHVAYLERDILRAARVQAIEAIAPTTLWKGTLDNECLSKTTDVFLTFNPATANNIKKFGISRPRHWKETGLLPQGFQSAKCVAFFCNRPCQSDGIKRILGLAPESFLLVFLTELPLGSHITLDSSTKAAIIRPPLNQLKIDTSPQKIVD